MGFPRLQTSPVLFPSRFTAVGTQTFSSDRPLFLFFSVLCRRAEPKIFLILCSWSKSRPRQLRRRLSVLQSCASFVSRLAADIATWKRYPRKFCTFVRTLWEEASPWSLNHWEISFLQWLKKDPLLQPKLLLQSRHIKRWVPQCLPFFTTFNEPQCGQADRPDRLTSSLLLRKLSTPSELLMDWLSTRTSRMQDLSSALKAKNCERSLSTAVVNIGYLLNLKIPLKWRRDN